MPRKAKIKKSVIGAAQEKCPYCSGSAIVKKGRREKKMEIVQLWYCGDCKKVFTPHLVKGKTYPLSAIIDGISYYNLGFSLEQSCHILKKKSGFDVQASTLSSWAEEFKDLCRYHRYRPFAVKRYSPYKVVETASSTAVSLE